MDTVYAYALLEDEPRIVGRLDVDNGAGTFVYGQSWLERDDRFALDPVQLPDRQGAFETTANNGIFHVLLDGGPDRFGRLVIERRHPGAGGLGAIDFLVYGSGHGTGCLLFSRSRDRVRLPEPAPGIERLTQLQDAALAVDTGQGVPDTAVDLLFPGSSLGGMRPKTVVSVDGEERIVKFGRRGADDFQDHPRVEHATLELARKAGIDAVESALHVVRGESILVIRRFDRLASRRLHYISALSLLANGGRVRESDTLGTLSYAGIAARAAQIGKDAGDIREVFRRAVFNVLISNTDDHLKNHGFLLEPPERQYRLAPAFDLVPSYRETGLQAIGTGPRGRESSWENVLASAGAFNISANDAQQIANEVRDAVAGWEAHYRAFDLAENDLRLVGRAIKVR